MSMSEVVAVMKSVKFDINIITATIEMTLSQVYLNDSQSSFVCQEVKNIIYLVWMLYLIFQLLQIKKGQVEQS